MTTISYGGGCPEGCCRFYRDWKLMAETRSGEVYARPMFEHFADAGEYEPMSSDAASWPKPSYWHRLGPIRDTRGRFI